MQGALPPEVKQLSLYAINPFAVPNGSTINDYEACFA